MTEQTVGDLLNALRHRGMVFAWTNIEARDGVFVQRAFRLHKDDLKSDLSKLNPCDPIRFYVSECGIDRFVYLGRQKP